MLATHVRTVIVGVHMLVPKHGNSPFIDGSSRFMDGYVNISVYELGWPIHVRASSISHPLFSSVSLRFGVVGWTYVVLYVISSSFVYLSTLFYLVALLSLFVPTTDRQQ